MPQRKVHIKPIGEVVLKKRRGNRTLRLSVAHDGEVRVSMPVWTPYKMGEAFVISKTDWLLKQLRSRQTAPLAHNDRVGKAHRVRLVHELREKISTRVTDTEIIIRVPLNHSAHDEDVQMALRLAAVRALKHEAKRLLPQRLNELATNTGLKYHSVSIKQLKSRWGSCNSNNDIALNCFLMQLPWELIDYVLLHELLHTRVMAHGPKFWDELAEYVPNLSAKRRKIRQFQPTLMPIAAI